MPKFTMVVGTLLAAVVVVQGHGSLKHFPINPVLGVSGFPDCHRLHPALHLDMVDASFDLACPQRGSGPAVRIGMVGDSITAGVHSSGGNHTYPFQTQMMLDAAHGWGAYTVTNLGACGSTMLRKGDSPYWERPQFKSLTTNTWDVVTIMLGTNDAKDPGSGGPNDWHHDCGEDAPLSGCTYAQDYLAMIAEVRKLGSPKIYAMIPPPLMQQGAYGMNETVINTVLPQLVPRIAAAAGVGLIDVFSGMGGVSAWRTAFPPHGCNLTSGYAPCGWWCDQQSCDQCHPNDVGYHHLATTVLAGLHTMPSPPSPPAPPLAAGVWLFEDGGSGKLRLTRENFTANTNSGREGAMAWDACRGMRDGATFDNGHPIWVGAAAKIAAVEVAGNWSAKFGGGCGVSYNYPTMAVSGPYTSADGLRYEGFIYVEL
jgi:acyl-CoA thioesterase-1